MSTPPSDHSTLVVSDGGPEDAENREKTTTVNPAWTWFSRHCLREIGEMSFSEMELEEDKMAYKKLFAVLEKEPYDNHFSVTVWIIQVILLVIFIILVSTFASVHVIHREWLHMRVHSWVALLMVVVSGYPVIRFVTFVVSEPLVWVWMRNNKYVYFFARFLKQSVDLTLWFTLLLWVWCTWFRPHVVKDIHGAKTLHMSVELYKGVVKQITRMLMALSIGALIWTLKTVVFLKLLAHLHYTDQFCGRIRRTILDLHGIQLILHKGRWSFLTQSLGVFKSNDDPFSFWIWVSRLKKKTAPIWILKRLTDTYLKHMKNKPGILHLLENVDDEEKFVEEAKYMLLEVIGDGQSHSDDYITADDLAKYGLEKKEIDHVLELFTSKEDEEPRERITKDQFLRWAVFALNNCLGLERTLQSSKHMFWKLDVVMSWCVVVLTLVIWLLLSELVTTSQIAILFAPFFSATFIFGESLRRSFDGIVFVFGMRPFDLGDRVIIENVEMRVSEMNIMTTIFIKYETSVEAIYANCQLSPKAIIYPNSELSTKTITNLDSTPDQPDIIEFKLPIDTPEELIFDLQVKIKKTLDDDVTFRPKTEVAKKSIGDKEVTWIVYFEYLVPYLSLTKTLYRSRILSTIINLSKELELLKERTEKEDPLQKEASILRFIIDVRVKMSEIDKLKDIIMRTLHDYNPSLKDGCQVLFTRMDKREIIMDVKMPGYLFKKPGDKDELRELIEHAIDNSPIQSEEKKVIVSWL